ncbi:glycine-rich domain-containing protein 1-like isoform X2 [Actinidia eriantha]|nr:glycine-rich domain-containing protein 1-like isoform X2 [Actinidia eriantha]
MKQKLIALGRKVKKIDDEMERHSEHLKEVQDSPTDINAIVTRQHKDFTEELFRYLTLLSETHDSLEGVMVINLPFCAVTLLFLTKQVVVSNEYQNAIRLPEVKEVEVTLEFVGVRNLPEGHKGGLSVAFSKSQPDIIFNTKRRLSILSESGEKQVAFFHCQPMGHLLFELVSHSSSTIRKPKPAKTLGSTSISLVDFLAPVSTLSVEKWLELVPSSYTVNSKPIGLRVALSFSIPTPAPHVLQMVRSRPFSKSSCFFPLPGRVKFTKSWTRVIDEAGNEVISLQMK